MATKVISDRRSTRRKPNQLAMGEVVSRYYQWLWQRDQKLMKARAAGLGKTISVVKI